MRKARLRLLCTKDVISIPTAARECVGGMSTMHGSVNLNVTAPHKHMLATPRYPSEIEPHGHVPVSHTPSLQLLSFLHSLSLLDPTNHFADLSHFSQRICHRSCENTTQQYTSQQYKLCVDKARPFLLLLLDPHLPHLSALNSVMCNYSQ